MAQSVESVRKEIGARVKNLREEHGWTDEVLGKMIGLSGSNLNNKERGIREFALDEIISLSDVFEITTDELLRGVKPKKSKRLESCPFLRVCTGCYCEVHLLHSTGKRILSVGISHL